jgi:fructose-bisphosphate aldolase class II
VRKVNIATAYPLAMTAAIRKFLVENPSHFDPRDYMKPARAAAKAICKQRYQQFGCEGRASRIQPIPLDRMAHKYRTGELSQHVH